MNDVYTVCRVFLWNTKNKRITKRLTYLEKIMRYPNFLQWWSSHMKNILSIQLRTNLLHKNSILELKPVIVEDVKIQISAKWIQPKNQKLIIIDKCLRIRKNNWKTSMEIRQRDQTMLRIFLNLVLLLSVNSVFGSK
jgi:hypothetical protein